MVARILLGAGEHARRLRAVLVADPLHPPEVRGRIDAELAQIVYHDAALALVRTAREIPGFECEPLATRRPPALRRSREARFLEQLLGAARVRAVPVGR